MLKRVLIALFPIVFLFLSSCGQSAPENDSWPFQQDVEYVIGIKADGLETKGLFSYKSNGTFTFTVQDENTPLNGLKETVSENEIITEYRGILWSSDEVITSFSRICKTLSNFENAVLISKEMTTFRGYNAIHLSYHLDEGTLHLWKKADDRAVLTIRYETKLFPFTLSFMAD